MAKQGLTERRPPALGEEADAAIRAVVARIPPGQVSSYGEVAARAGLPGRARMVGKVLGKTPDGEELPWYRVLRSDGRIAFAPQSKAYREQRARLIGEGVRVERGRVDLARHGWDRNLDFALWAPVGEVPAVEVTSTKASRAKASKVEASKVGASKVGATKVGATKVRASKVGASKVGASKVGASKVGVSKVGVSKVGVSKVGVSKVGAISGTFRKNRAKAG